MAGEGFRGRYYINGIDIFSQFGIGVTVGGMQSLEQWPKRKEQYKYVFKDRNGTERSERFSNRLLFESKAVTLEMCLVFTDRTDYLAKSRAFRDFMLTGAASGYFKLYCKHLEAEYTLLYDDNTDFVIPENMFNADGFANGDSWVLLNIQFIDDFKVEYGIKEYDQFISTWDTRNISAGSSDANTITFPSNTVVVPYMIDWGDGSPITPIRYGNSTVSIPGDNMVTVSKLVSIGFSRGISYNIFNGLGSGVALKNILPSDDVITDTLYIRHDIVNITSTGARLRIDYEDGTNVIAVSGITLVTTKPIKSIVFTYGNSGTFEIRDLIISKSNVPYQPSLIDMKPSHTYITQGVYTIKCIGVIDSSVFNNGGDKLKIVEINSWGNFTFRTLQFFGCTNLKLDKTFGIPTILGGLSMFRTCASLTTIKNIDLWNLKSISRLDSAFSNATLFDQDLGNLNVESISNMDGFMLGKTPSTFSAKNLDSIYINWSKKNLQRNVPISFGTAKYTAAAATARALLISKFNWSITDGGQI